MIFRLYIAVLCLVLTSYSFAQTGSPPAGHAHYIIGVTAVDSPVDITRKRIGVGEEVYLKFEPSHPCTWQIVSGRGTLSKTSETSAKFTAPDNTNQGDKTVIKAVCHKQGSATVTYEIVKPDGVIMEKMSQSDNEIPLATEMVARIYITPADVNFHKIKTQEDRCDPITEGYFSYQKDVHPQGTWIGAYKHVEGKGTMMASLDKITAVTKGPIYSQGKFLWPIPWKYYLNSDQGVFTIVNHVKRLELPKDTVTLTITKAGASSSVSISTK